MKKNGDILPRYASELGKPTNINTELMDETPNQVSSLVSLNSQHTTTNLLVRTITSPLTILVSLTTTLTATLTRPKEEVFPPYSHLNPPTILGDLHLKPTCHRMSGPGK